MDNSTTTVAPPGVAVPDQRSAGRPAEGELVRRRPGHWIDDWRPEDPDFWERGGARVARRNLIFSILSEHIGFSVWVIWSVMVLFMPEAVYGFTLADKFLLTTMPAIVGSFIRLPYTFAIAKFGGRNWTVISASLLLIPSILAAFLLQPGVSLGTLLIVTALAGVGGGNFASSMANINNFYPQRLKGRALGLNAGGGNLGVAVAQLVGVAVILAAGKTADPRIMLAVYIPLVVVTAALAWVTMDNLTEAKNDKGAMREVARHAHTWIISFLYIGTFGSFIGFGFAFGQVLKQQTDNAIYFVWVGAAVGSLIRPVGGILADRLSGSAVTLWNFWAMTAMAGLVLVASLVGSLPLFIVGFILLFALTGVGNGSVYKMIPAIFHAKSLDGSSTDAKQSAFQARRLASALVGVAGAVGAFGGVLVQVAFRQSFLSFGNGNAAYIGFIAFYAICGVVTWVVYRRSGPHRLVGV